jgi:hypothetical protein
MKDFYGRNKETEKDDVNWINLALVGTNHGLL